MQIVKFKMQNANKLSCTLHFAFCIFNLNRNRITIFVKFNFSLSE